MGFLSSGHTVVSIVDFGEGWQLPEICSIVEVSESMFRTEAAHKKVMFEPHSAQLGLHSALLSASGGNADARQPCPKIAAPASTRGGLHGSSLRRRPAAPRKAKLAALADKLYSVLQWALARGGFSLASASRVGPDSVPAGPSSSTLASTRVSPTDKGKAYKEYLKERTQWKLSPRTTAVPPKVAQKVRDIARENLERETSRISYTFESWRTRAVQAKLDMQGGSFLEYDRAMETVAVLEQNVDEMDPALRTQTAAVLAEFITSQRRRRAGTEMYRACPEVFGRWLANPSAFLEDFVVVQATELYVNAEFAEEVPKENQDVVIKGIQAFIADIGSDVHEQLNLQPASGSDSKCWHSWEKTRPKVLNLEPKAGAEAMELACRLARAQWCQGGAFTLKVRCKLELEEVFGPVARVPTKSEKEAMDRLRRNLGHPSARDLARALAVSRAPAHLIKFAKEDYRCASCEAHKAPKWNRPTTVPRSYAPNVVVGLDLMQIPNHDGTQALWMLNMVCMGTSFQLVERKE
ncbi:unnamed protein product [Symbiodinium sp. CCMP2592]|nr:unnamed protein product [Symbiodinium sp. CCMP2592]